MEVNVQITTKGAEGIHWHSILGKHFQKGKGCQDHMAVSSGWFGRGTARSGDQQDMLTCAG